MHRLIAVAGAIGCLLTVGSIAVADSNAGIQSGSASPQDILSVLQSVDDSLKQFERVTDKINFSTWTANYGYTEAAREMLDGIRSGVKHARASIENGQDPGRVSPPTMFLDYDTLAGAASVASNLSHEESTVGRNSALGSELAETASATLPVLARFRDALFSALIEQERQAGACRPR